MAAIRGSADNFSEEQMRDFHKHRLPLLTEPHSVASQQYGILALKVAAWMRQNKGRILAITSATGGEGKSLTALNLSLALAASSQGRVLLVDCDFRLPQVHERLGLKTAKGLSDLLAGNRNRSRAFFQNWKVWTSSPAAPPPPIPRIFWPPRA